VISPPLVVIEHWLAIAPGAPLDFTTSNIRALVQFGLVVGLGYWC